MIIANCTTSLHRLGRRFGSSLKGVLKIMATWNKIAIIALLVVLAIVVAIQRIPQPTTSEQQSPNPEVLVRITPHRIPLAASVAVLCITPTLVYGPHKDAAEVHIYANQRAIDYRHKHPNAFDYPIGSKFVKEKYSHPGDENPDAATIMERTANKGDVSDWNFSIVSLPDKTPLEPSSEVTCAECHRNFKDTGFVSSDSERCSEDT